MPMQPSPIADTRRPEAPRRRNGRVIVSLPTFRPSPPPNRRQFGSTPTCGCRRGGRGQPKNSPAFALAPLFLSRKRSRGPKGRVNAGELWGRQNRPRRGAPRRPGTPPPPPPPPQPGGGGGVGD